MAEQEERIAQRLRKLRADIGDPKRPGKPLPVEEAADQAKVRNRQWQRWESGKTFPRPQNLERVAATFGLDVSEFYETENGREATQLDQIQTIVEELYFRVTGERYAAATSEVLGQLPDRLSGTAASRLRKAPRQSGSRAEASRRKNA